MLCAWPLLHQFIIFQVSGTSQTWVSCWYLLLKLPQLHPDPACCCLRLIPTRASTVPRQCSTLPQPRASGEHLLLAVYNALFWMAAPGQPVVQPGHGVLVARQIGRPGHPVPRRFLCGGPHRQQHCDGAASDLHGRVSAWLQDRAGTAAMIPHACLVRPAFGCWSLTRPHPGPAPQRLWWQRRAQLECCAIHPPGGRGQAAV